ncbi:MAG: InlB B-repeat-containing protein [Opitutaceae bacterium]
MTFYRSLFASIQYLCLFSLSLIGLGFPQLCAREVVFSEDFLGSLPSLDWEYYSSSNTYGRIQVVGNRMRMDVTTDGNSSLNEAIFTLDLADALSANISFQQLDVSDEETSLPGEFNGHYDGDGVAISADGTTWYTVVNASELNTSSLTTFNVDLFEARASIRANFDVNFDFTSTFKIKFQQYDNYASPRDGREWDTVDVTVEFADLELSLSAESEFLEGSSSIPATLTVDSALASDLVVNLSGDSFLNLPATVTILAGQTSVDFSFSIVDDTDTQGDRAATITASATDYAPEIHNLTVHDDETLYTVTFDLDGKSTLDAGDLLQSVVWGQPAVEPSVTANDGWGFVGWDMDFVNVTEDLTITAQYLPTHSVVFNLDGKSIRVNGGDLFQTVIEGQSAVDPILDVEGDWHFSGWDVDFSSVSTDFVVTAQYLPKHMVVFILDGKASRISGGELTQSIVDGRSALEPVLSVNPGWIFDSWDQGYDVISGALTITAQYRTIIQSSPTVIPAGESTFFQAVETEKDLSYQWYQGETGDTSSPVSGAIGSLLVTPPIQSDTNFWVRVVRIDGVFDGTAAELEVVQPDGKVLLGMGVSSGAMGLGLSDVNLYAASPMRDVIEVSAGGSHSLFVKSDGTLWATGSNYVGQLGDGTQTDQTSPVFVANGVSKCVAGLGSGFSHSLFLKDDGTLWGMGTGTYGNLGASAGVQQLTPIQIASDVVDIAAGSIHTLYIKEDGTLWSLGRNNYGQLGDGSLSNRHLSVQVASDVTSVRCGGFHSLFTKSDGSLWAMGRNHNGQLGDGTQIDRHTPVKVADGVKDFDASNHISVFVKYDDTLWVMGYILSGMLANGGNTIASTPIQLATDAHQVSAGDYHILYLTRGGALFGIGSNTSGQLGGGDSESRSVPELITEGVVRFSAGGHHSFYVKTDGTAWSMGSNANGELGYETNSQINSATYIIDGVISVASESDHTLVLKDDGTVWGTGGNNYGQLGDGTYSDRRAFKQIASDVRRVNASRAHSFLLKTNGDLWAMGLNQSRQLGVSSQNYTNTPIFVSSDVVSMSGGSSHSLFIKDDGTMWGAGANRSGQLGDGTNTSSTFSVRTADGVAAVAAGSSHSLFLQTDGTLWSMGSNYYGQLGDGTTESRNIPFLVADQVVRICAGTWHSLFIKADGTLWGVGINSSGQLGDGTDINRYEPVFIADEVCEVSAGDYHSLFKKEDGTLWAMGSNFNGEFGTDSNQAFYSPVQISSDVALAVACKNASFHLVEEGRDILHDVTFDFAGKGVRVWGGLDAQQVIHGKKAYAPIVGADFGWYFTGWDASFDNITSDLIVTAQYLPVHTVTFNLVDKSTGVLGALEQQIVDGAWAAAPSPTPSLGWFFDGWDSDFNLVRTDLNVTALYVIDSRDDDGDNILDWWEEAFFMTTEIADELSDSDGDGRKDYDEFQSGNDPMDHSDYFHVIEDAVSPVDGKVTLRFTTNDDVGSRRYRICYTDDLTTTEPWLELPMGAFAPDAGDSTEKTFDAPGDADGYFFKVEAFIEE